MIIHLGLWVRILKGSGAKTHRSDRHPSVKEPAVPLLVAKDPLSPNVVHPLPKMGTDATEVHHPGAERVSRGGVPLEDAPLIGVGTAGAKTVVALICHEQVVRDRLSGIENFVRPLTDGRDHLPTTIVIEIPYISLGLGLSLDTLHDLWHRRHPLILPTLEETRGCTQPDLSSLL